VFLEGEDRSLLFSGKANWSGAFIQERDGFSMHGDPAFDRIYIEYNGFLCKKQNHLDLLKY